MTNQKLGRGSGGLEFTPRYAARAWPSLDGDPVGDALLDAGIAYVVLEASEVPEAEALPVVRVGDSDHLGVPTGRLNVRVGKGLGASVAKTLESAGYDIVRNWPNLLVVERRGGRRPNGLPDKAFVRRAFDDVATLAAVPGVTAVSPQVLYPRSMR